MGTVTDKLSRLLQTKNAIREAITGKGQDVADTDPFSSYAAKIAAIQVGAEIYTKTVTQSVTGGRLRITFDSNNEQDNRVMSLLRESLIREIIIFAEVSTKVAVTAHTTRQNIISAVITLESLTKYASTVYSIVHSSSETAFVRANSYVYELTLRDDGSYFDIYTHGSLYGGVSYKVIFATHSLSNEVQGG